MSRGDLIAISKETMKFTEDFIKKSGYYECADVEVYSPEHLQDIENDVDEFFEQSFCGTEGASFYIVNADSFEAAGGLDRALVMNFANAHTPGGGFLTGARAQEESLCRCSTLYKSISSHKAKEMYNYNNTHKSPCDSDYMLISPSVYVYRSFTGELLEMPFWTSVVTVPAPNKCGAASKISQDVLDEVMMERLRKMLFLAARRGYSNLVLGAWGCGAFGNDAKRVATYFYDLFFGEDGFHKFFEKVVFAILGDENKIEFFKEVFQDKAQVGCPDVFLMDTDMDEKSEGYYVTEYDYPVCNHTEGVTDINVGYIKGITVDGLPFEAELFEKDEILTMAVIIPKLDYDGCEDEKDGELLDDGTNIVPMHCQVMSFDGSILDVGMVDNGTEENIEVVMEYVNLLVDNGIVQFATDLYDGAVQYRTDILGNDLAKILITLREGEDFLAYTNLNFVEFKKTQSKNKLKFKVIRRKENK